MTNDAAIKEAATTNSEMISTLLLIHRVASRALSTHERVGQRIQGDLLEEIRALLTQMMVVEKLSLAGLPKEGRELLDLAVAKEETAAIRAEGRKAH
ncbi:hypothetical protein ABIF68_003669 [Bradyrhizobium japonicum]|jgi:hypothetical protein|uniref:hypothetical protein n=1 Tax=Bradyrhizobium TaxID=374 RepID=UPI0004B9A805|nr:MULTISPECIES: hypothetical protein [Bradyrhizobium]MDI2073894.1 hypothetical protein [Bradyrhizobium sp. Mp27]